MTNQEWINLLVYEWDVSRTVAREMIHKMMEIKRKSTSKGERYEKGKD